MAKNRHLVDQELLARMAQQDDQRAYAALYEHYAERLLRHAYRMLKDEEEAKDAVQDLFITLWEKRSTLQNVQALSPYLYTTIQHNVLRRMERSKLRNTYIDTIRALSGQGEPTTDLAVQERELKQAIEREVANLPGKMQAVFRLSREESLTNAEIASQLGISENTVKRQISNSLLILRKKLADWIFFLLALMVLQVFLFFI